MTGPLQWFGTRLEGWTYQPRPSAYVVQFDRHGQLLVVRSGGRTNLPGGRIEADESASQAAIRELREETGLDVAELSPLCVAGQWSVNRRRDAAYEKHCAFFLSRVAPRRGGRAEAGHEPAWLPSEAALCELHYESHCWAVRTAIAMPADG